MKITAIVSATTTTTTTNDNNNNNILNIYTASYPKACVMWQ